MKIETVRVDSLQVEYLPIADLLPYARNSRTHSDEQIAQIASSIREFGFTNPVLVSDKNDIIAGHGRVRAAAKLDMAQVPCIRLGHLTATQRKAYVIADNKLGLNSGWDTEMLRLELEELGHTDFNLDLLGFDKLEIGALLPFEPQNAEDQSGGDIEPWGQPPTETPIDAPGAANRIMLIYTPEEYRLVFAVAEQAMDDLDIHDMSTLFRRLLELRIESLKRQD